MAVPKGRRARGSFFCILISASCLVQRVKVNVYCSKSTASGPLL